MKETTYIWHAVHIAAQPQYVSPRYAQISKYSNNTCAATVGV